MLKLAFIWMDSTSFSPSSKTVLHSAGASQVSMRERYMAGVTELLICLRKCCFRESEVGLEALSI